MSLKWLWLFFWLTGPTNQNRPIANRFNFYVFSTIWMKFGMWTANAPAQLLLLPCSCIAPGLLLACSQPAPGLLMVCSCPAPDPAHPSFAAFIIISTLRLFSARREPPFMVLHPKLPYFATITCARYYPPYEISPKSDEKHRSSNFWILGPPNFFWKLAYS